MFVDSHCHLDFPDLVADLPQVLQRMRENQVSNALVVSVSLDRWPALLDLVKQHDHLYASVGVHPDYEDTPEPSVEELVNFAKSSDKVVAIGETGLDYFRKPEPLEWQRDRFRTHIRASRASGLPLIMDLGFYISLSGIVTFKNAVDLQEVARRVPLDRLLIETDSPFLAPVPHRGKTNDPSMVIHVAEKIADLKGLPVVDIARHSKDNFFKLFNKIRTTPNVE